MVQWLALMAHSKKFLGLNSVAGWGFSVWSLHALPMLVWVFSGYSGFLPQPERHEWVMLTGNSKLAIGVNSFSLSV